MAITQGCLVSIVTPCLNNAEFLPRCLDSIRDQTYDNVEHIVIDGGSDDGTVELLRDRDGIAWVSEPDGGQTAAINKGWRMATGEILTWLNADDWLYPSAVAIAVHALASHPEAGWVIGQVHIDEAGATRDIPPPDALSLGDLDESNPVVQPGAFIARSALDTVGLLDEDEDLVMDLELWYRLLGSGFSPVTVPDILAGAEIHGKTKTRTRGDRAYATDFGMARLKHGRREAGSVWLGRAAAYACRDAGDLSSKSLRLEIGNLEVLAAGRGYAVSVPAIRAGARATASALERGALRRARHLLDPAVWVHGSTRRLVLGAARSRVARSVQPRRSDTVSGTLLL